MEITTTTINPFGEREESGANGSLWNVGGGIIGSSDNSNGGSGTQYVTVPNLVGLTTQAATDLLISLGLTLNGTVPVSTNATIQNNGTVSSQGRPAGESVPAGTAVLLVVFNYVAPTELIAPTNNWSYIGSLESIHFYGQSATDDWAYGGYQNFHVLITGGANAGSYPITGYSIGPGFVSVGVSGFPTGASDADPDGIASVIHN